jgi:microcystin-dependent protein
MSVNAIEPLGSGQPVPTQSPSLSMTWCIAYLGVFPPRN